MQVDSTKFRTLLPVLVALVACFVLVPKTAYKSVYKDERANEIYNLESCVTHITR